MVSTNGRGGSILNKHIMVSTDDPQKPEMELVVFGKVNAYIEVKPAFVRLMGKPGEDLSATVQILQQEGHPFSVKQIKAREGKDIRFELKPLGKDANGREKGFSLEVRNTRGEPGIIRDLITIETDLKEKPQINIPVSGRLFEPQAAGSPGAAGGAAGGARSKQE